MDLERESALAETKELSISELNARLKMIQEYLIGAIAEGLSKTSIDLLTNDADAARGSLKAVIKKTQTWSDDQKNITNLNGGSQTENEEPSLVMQS